MLRARTAREERPGEIRRGIASEEKKHKKKKKPQPQARVRGGSSVLASDGSIRVNSAERKRVFAGRFGSQQGARKERGKKKKKENVRMFRPMGEDGGRASWETHGPSWKSTKAGQKTTRKGSSRQRSPLPRRFQPLHSSSSPIFTHVAVVANGASVLVHAVELVSRSLPCTLLAF